MLLLYNVGLGLLKQLFFDEKLKTWMKRFRNQQALRVNNSEKMTEPREGIRCGPQRVRACVQGHVQQKRRAEEM